MGNTKRNKITEEGLDALNHAFSIAVKNYKRRHGKVPECGFHVEFTSDMTHEEELLEVFHALIRAGKTPNQAKDMASVTLQEIYNMQEQFEKGKSGMNA
jgi:hypothetical protein